MKKNPYREPGAIGALLDEYERAVKDLKKTLKTVSDTELTTAVAANATDTDCISIQTILTHVVRSGHGYATYIRQKQGEKVTFRKRIVLNSVKAYCQALDEMFAANVQLFADYPNLPTEEYDVNKKIVVAWGQIYDIEQLLEHAIVHILRHRRQIERYLLELR